jgi:uncharacterized iron-regulated protein
MVQRMGKSLILFSNIVLLLQLPQLEGLISPRTPSFRKQRVSLFGNMKDHDADDINLFFTSSFPKVPEDEASEKLKGLCRFLIATGGLLSASAPNLAVAADNVIRLNPPPQSQRPLAYSVEFTDPPCLQPRSKVGEDGAIKRFADNDIVLLGEHHGSPEDHELQANLLSRMYDEVIGNRKELVLGLEMVQRGNQAFQAALDTYINSKKVGVSEEEADIALERDTDWNNNWKWDFAAYKPVLHVARNKGIRLVALNVGSAAMKRVLDDGLDGLTDGDRSTYVPDPQGFVESVKGTGFQRYTDNVILPSYDYHVRNGLLGDKPSPEKFFASRILRDEAIASAAAKFVQENPASIMVVLAGEERVKFGYGIQERAKRALTTMRKSQSGDSAAPAKVLSVLLNPTAIDSLSLTMQLRLTLAYGKFLVDQRPLADFLWFSKSPAVKLLTRPKNPINREGEKPPGESSIIGAF